MFGQKDSNITSSQVSGVVNQHDQNRRTHTGDQTLLSQYKMCNAMNDEQLKGAKNIKDLVNINVVTLDKQLFVEQRRSSTRNNGRTQKETEYNLQFDPINFLQKVPQMGERDFMINQAILHNSTHKNRVSEALNRQKFIQQTNYDSRKMPPQTTKSSNGGLRRLLPELPIGGLSVKRPRPNRFGSMHSIRASKNKASTNAGTNKLEIETENRAGAEPEADYEFESIQMSGRGSQIDPVRCLQGIFQKKDVKKRNPALNPVVEKYKQMARSQRGSYTRSGARNVTTANTFTSPAQAQAASYLGSVKDSVISPTGENFFSKPLRQSEYNPSRLAQQGRDHILHQQEETQMSMKFNLPATAPMGASRPTYQSNNFDIEEVSPELNTTSGAHEFQSQRAPARNLFSKRQTMPVVTEQRSNTKQSSLLTNHQQPQQAQPEQQLSINQDQASRNINSTTSYLSQPSTTQNQQQKSIISPNVGDELTQAQFNIREKLKAMKQLFDDEDDTNKDQASGAHGLPRPESSEWDLHNHKLMYEEALEKRKRHLEIVEKRKESQGVQGETPTQHKKGGQGGKNTVNHNFEMQEDELRDFLINRIADLKHKGEEEENLGQVQFKFKASTISNVLPSGHQIEQMRLEANYKKRFTKGQKVHQRILNTQQRKIQKRNSVQRISHLQAMEQCKKDVISSRSGGRTRSPSSGSVEAQTTGVFVNHPGAQQQPDQTLFSLRSGSPQRRHQRQSRINTDLDEHDEGLMSEGIQTQKASIMQEMRAAALTPQIMDNREIMIHQEEAVAVASEMKPYENDYENFNGPRSELQTPQQARPDIGVASDREMSPKFYHEAELGSGNLDEQQPLSNDQYEESVLFKLDEGSIDEYGKRQNKYSQVMKSLGAIDKKFDKDNKLRKKGLKMEALNMIAKMKEEQQADDAADVEEQILIQQISYKDQFETRKLSHSDITQGKSAIGEELQELINTSLQDQSSPRNDNQPDDKSLKGTSAVIIVQVSQPSTSNNENVSELKNDKSDCTQEDHRNNQSSMIAGGNRRGVQVVHSKSRSFSQASNKPSRINTNEDIKSEEQAMHTKTVSYQQRGGQHRESDYTVAGDSNTPRTTSLVILNRGGNKYSNKQIDTEKKEPQQPDEPMTAARPDSKDSVEISPRADVDVDIDSDNIDVGHTMELESITQKTTLQPHLILKKISNQHIFQVNKVKDQAVTGQSDPMTEGSVNEPVENSVENDDLNRAINANKEMFPSYEMNMAQSMVTGSQMSYFCPKRFNRYPRFTIFFKKGQKTPESSYIAQNTVSLNSDFLQFLSNKNTTSSPRQETQPQTAQRRMQQAEKEAQGKNSKVPGNTMSQGKVFSVSELNNFEKQNNTESKVPRDVQQWNDYLKQKDFDPFDRVVLVKGIDNSILTSFRTLKGDNNTVSDTFKIVHKKFAPSKTNNSYFKNIMSKHIDKLPYQTKYDIDELNEMIDEEMDDFEVYEEKDDGTFEQVTLPDKVQIDVDTTQLPLLLDGKDATQELSSTNLQHAITTALIDLEKEVSNTVRSSEKKSPFKVLKTVEGINQINLDFNEEVETAENSTKKRAEQRMPRPKPLSLNKQPKKVTKQTSSDKLVLSNPFGVQGVSPLTQLANNMLREQIKETVMVDDTATDQSPETFKVKLLPYSPGVMSNSVTAQNSIYKIHEPAFEANIEDITKEIGSKKSSGGTMMIGQNLKFSSQGMVASPPSSQELQKKSPPASKSQTGTRFMGAPKVNHKMHEVASAAHPGKLTHMTKHQRQPGEETKHHLGSDTDTIKLRSSMFVAQADDTQKDVSKFDKPITPISLHMATKHSMLMEGQSPGQANYIATQKRPRHDPDDSQGEIRDSWYTKAGMESESQNEMFTSMGEKGHSPINALQYAPTVNVIKSKAQVNSLASSLPIESMEADAGDTSKRTIVGGGGVYVLDSTVALENLDYFHNSPLVHQALGPRKHIQQKKQYDSLQPGSVIAWTNSASSPRSIEQTQAKAKAPAVSEKPSYKVAPAPAEHVGVLQVPDSLKAQHAAMGFAENNAVETVAMVGAKLGAVSNMINKIYEKDRRMINSMYKGNMLSTTVLTDLNRYHKLKSSTGVENKNYDKIWLQEKIEEEKQDIGLSLDCAPNANATTESKPTAEVLAKTTIFTKEATDKATLQKSLKGSLGDDVKKSGGVLESNENNFNYGEMVNRSETGTALSKANYH